MSVLWVVATPIGNLEDMTYRAVRVLGSVRRILCEDTRRTRSLLEHVFPQGRPEGEFQLVRFDAHAERERIEEALNWLSQGESLALVSDAGTPGINDPGERLVRAAAAAGYQVSPIPGPSSVIAALSASGLGGGGFSFGGFLPKGVEAQKTKLAALPQGVWSFFVPARDLLETLEIMSLLPIIGHIVIAREITKLHESFYRGKAAELLLQLQADVHVGLGEAVIVFEVIAPVLDDEAILAMLRVQLGQGQSPKGAVEIVAGALNLPKRRVYQLALTLEK